MILIYNKYGGNVLFFSFVSIPYFNKKHIFVSVRLFLQIFNKLTDFYEALYELRASKFNR
jgi:hypothetical protein